VGTVSLQKRRSFSSQGSNWTCQTAQHLHGNDFLFFLHFVARLSQRLRVCTRITATQRSHGGRAGAARWRVCENAHRTPSQIPHPNQYGWLFYGCFWEEGIKQARGPAHKNPGRVSRSLCCNPNRSATLYCVGLWRISTFFCVCAHSIYLPLLFLHNSRFSSVIEVSREEQVYYLLQLSALFAVFLWRSSTGLPLNAIRLRLWLFAFLIIAGMLFEACDKHSAAPPPPFLGACMRTRQHRRRRAGMQNVYQAQFGKLSVSQHVRINLLRAICQEIFSFKQPSVNRDEALSMGQGPAGT